MDLIVAWILFPGVLLALAVGCGSLVARAAGPSLPRALIPAAGLALIVVVAGFLTLADETAELATPAVVALALAGLVFGRRSLGRPSGWALAAAAGVFALYAAPIVLSGEATFAGYIRLDDTATWLALTDRVLEHGRDLDGLAPSTYEATLAFNLADGYPVGVFLPLGIAGRLLGEDVAWLIQPYMATVATMLALALWSLARSLVASAPLRTAIAFVGAQSALLFGYYLWGGVKEIAAAMLIASIAGCLSGLVAARLETRALVAPALLSAALAGALSAGGLIWVAPMLALACWLGVRGLAPRRAFIRVSQLGALIALLALPVLAGGVLPPTAAPLTDAGAQGNLIGPLEAVQVAGIWPAGDFRLEPVAELPAQALIALMIVAAAVGLAVAARARDWGALAYVGGALLACLAIGLLGSPWVDAKALATAAPVLPFAAGLAIAALVARGLRAAAIALGVALAAGVLWSNALAYRDANLAPREQLAELERIGEEIAGEGPALLTEYQPYGARHFLRAADPEAASELRRRRVALAGGGTVAKGEGVDTDALDPAGLFAYRTLVLRRSPVQSRPPAAYRLARRGEFYDVWQRRGTASARVARLGLGTATQPVARPRCERVARLAARARPGARLVAASRPRVLATSLRRARYPRSWSTPATRATPTPVGAGTIQTRVEIERRDDYTIWLAGSARPAVELAIDGLPAGEIRHQLNNRGQYLRLGEAELSPGAHRVTIRFGGADLHPGSGGAPAAVGPLVLAAAEAADAKLVRVPAGEARSLCERAWDWIEIDRLG